MSRPFDRQVAPAQRRVCAFGSAATSSSLPSPCGMAPHASKAPNQYPSIPNHSSPRSTPSPSDCPLIHLSRTWSIRLTEGCAHRQWLLRSIGGIILGQRLAAATAKPAIAALFTPSCTRCRRWTTAFVPAWAARAAMLSQPASPRRPGTAG